jgi:hypothetical protein
VTHRTRTLSRWRLPLIALVPMAIVTGGWWYLSGARDPARLAIGLTAFAAVFLFAVMVVSRTRWHRLTVVIVGLAACAGAALTPPHVDVIGLAVGYGLLLSQAIPWNRLPGRGLLARAYVAIGGTRDAPAPQRQVSAATTRTLR